MKDVLCYIDGSIKSGKAYTNNLIHILFSHLFFWQEKQCIFSWAAEDSFTYALVLVRLWWLIIGAVTTSDQNDYVYLQYHTYSFIPASSVLNLVTRLLTGWLLREVLLVCFRGEADEALLLTDSDDIDLDSCPADLLA